MDRQTSIASQVEGILAEMTLEEKVAQLGSINAEVLLTDGELDSEKAAEHLGDGIGHITRIGGEGALPPREAAQAIADIQSYLKKETRLGIPAIPHEECLSGYMGPKGTTYPQMLGMASSWNPDLLGKVTTAIKEELQAIGAVHALSPVLDVARDFRWGRVEETFGEDPYLVASMARAYVQGLQGGDNDGISATLKHFVGHGGTVGGKNRSSLNIGSRELREIHLFPYEAVIAETGAESVMNAYHDIDGVPCARSEWLLTDVLRGELGFDGTVVSDYYSIRFLETEHKIVDSGRAAAVYALEAGIDVELPFTDCYDELVDAVESGELNESTVDTSVQRILAMKARKGVLSDAGVDVASSSAPFNTESRQELTLEAARESMVLLENKDNLLPLDEFDSIAVVGPKADSDKGLLGDYAFPAHYTGEEYSFSGVTPLNGLESYVDDDVRITFSSGCSMTGSNKDGFSEAVAAAEDADVAIVCVGAQSAVDTSSAQEENSVRTNIPTSGEGCDVADLGLPGVQEELVRSVYEAGTPVVVVLVSGKPHAIPWIAEHIDAVLAAGLPGEEGGHAIAETLFGDVNPGGHLPVSVPKTAGQQPVYYNRKPNSATVPHVFVDPEPLYPFGHGLHYTDFAYEDFCLSTSTVKPAGTMTAQVTVRNTGHRKGDDVVQLYVHAESPSIARPVQELLGFERVTLRPGEAQDIVFEINIPQLAFYDVNMSYRVEKGKYELSVGHSAKDIVDRVSFTISDTREIPRSGRRYFTTVSRRD